jgi:hypothetical protein
MDDYDDYDEVDYDDDDVDSDDVGLFIDRPAPKVIPRPEIVCPADWRVIESGQACVDLPGKTLFVPMDSSVDSRTARIHEYSHCRFSRGAASTAAKRAGVPNKVLQAVEDARVNLAYEAERSKSRSHRLGGLPIPPLMHSPELIAAQLKHRTTEADRALMEISLCGTADTIEHELKSETRMHVRAVRSAMKRAMRKRGRYATAECFTVRARNKIARDLALRIGLMEDPSDKDKPKSMRETPGSAKMRSRGRMIEMHRKAGISADELAEAMRTRGASSGRYEARRVPWGKMTVKTAKMPRRVSGRFHGKRWRPSDEGAEIEYPERKPLDGRCFRMKARGNGATVLIDTSGSMGLDSEEIIEILEAAPGSLIAMYSGHTGPSGRGILTIIGRCKRAAESREIDCCNREAGGGNVIDGPALDWLARQRSPRIWVSDGEVTGRGDCQDGALFNEAADTIQRGRILRIGTPARAIRYLKGARGIGTRDRAAIHERKH